LNQKGGIFMKKLIALLMTLMLCFAAIPALSEGTATSSEFDPAITIMPEPGWAVTIHCAQEKQTLAAGSTVILTAEITTAQPDYYKLSDYTVSYNWLAKKTADGGWESVGTGETYEFNLNADNVNWIFKVTVTLSK
jgi:hypothetical protein